MIIVLLFFVAIFVVAFWNVWGERQEEKHRHRWHAPLTPEAEDKLKDEVERLLGRKVEPTSDNQET